MRIIDEKEDLRNSALTVDEAVNTATLISNEFEFAVIPVCPPYPHQKWVKDKDGGFTVVDRPEKEIGKAPILSAWERSDIRGEEIKKVFSERAAKQPNGGVQHLNYGVNCEPSRILVIDRDPKNGGDTPVKELPEFAGLIPETYMVDTGSGGDHTYLKIPDGVELLSDTPLSLLGYDIRCKGGQALAEGSLHRSGRSYTHKEGTPRTIAVASPELIEKIRQLQTEPKQQRSEDEGEFKAYTNPIFDEGKPRHDQLRDYAKWLCVRGLDSDEIQTLLEKADDAKFGGEIQRRNPEEVPNIIDWVMDHIEPDGEIRTAEEVEEEYFETHDFDITETAGSLIGREMETPEMIIPGLDAGDLMLIAGQPNAGKTLVMSNICASVASAVELWKRITPESDYPILYIASETSDYRYKQILSGIKEKLTDEEKERFERNFHVLSKDTIQKEIGLGEALITVTKQGASVNPKYARVINRCIDKYGIKMCVLDTVNNLVEWMRGENDNNDAKIVCKTLWKWGFDKKCCFCLVHHMNRSSDANEETEAGTFVAKRGGSGVGGMYAYGGASAFQRHTSLSLHIGRTSDQDLINVWEGKNKFNEGAYGIFELRLDRTTFTYSLGDTPSDSTFKNQYTAAIEFLRNYGKPVLRQDWYTLAKDAKVITVEYSTFEAWTDDMVKGDSSPVRRNKSLEHKGRGRKPWLYSYAGVAE